MVNDSGDETVDHEEWAQMIQSQFQALWKCEHPHSVNIQRECMERCHGAGITFSHEDVSRALANLRNPGVLDKYGCSVAGFRLVFAARLQAVRDALTDLARCADDLASLVILGQARAKAKGPIAASKVRTILPLPVVLAILDFWLAEQMHAIVDRYASRILPMHRMSPYLECAKRYRQTLDAVHPLALIIEKGLDNASRGCVAQQDVTKILRLLISYEDRQMAAQGDGLMGCGGNTAQATLLPAHCPPGLLCVRIAQGTDMWPAHRIQECRRSGSHSFP